MSHLIQLARAPHPCENVKVSIVKLWPSRHEEVVKPGKLEVSMQLIATTLVSIFTPRGSPTSSWPPTSDAPDSEV